jgi:hypothetical protein
MVRSSGRAKEVDRNEVVNAIVGADDNALDVAVEASGAFARVVEPAIAAAPLLAMLSSVPTCVPP